MGGIYNNVTDNVSSYGYNSNGDIALIKWDPKLDDQYELEGLVAAILFYLGSLGLYLQKEATKDPHNTNRATNLQAIGFVLTFISFLIIEKMIDYKTAKSPP
jgi:hypothetical protein